MLTLFASVTYFELLYSVVALPGSRLSDQPPPPLCFDTTDRRTMSTDPNRHHTRAATRAGIYPAPKLPRDTPSPTSSPHSSSRSLGRATGSPKSRPVTPELLYSTVASAVSLTRGVSPEKGDVPGSPSANALSELPSLNRDVDFGVRTKLPISTVVHGEAMSVRSNDIDLHVTPLPPPPSAQSDSVSTVDMSHDELVSLARRYESMARNAMAEANRKLSVPFDTELGLNGAAAESNSREFPPLSPAIPADEGPSRNKGKGPDPRNWGAIGSLIDFSEEELEAQHEAFQNFAEINRVVKQEERECTPRPHVPNVGLKPTIKIPKVNPTVSDPLPENKGTTMPGQADAERIAELERELS
ncbi:hypothetical protein B0H13DRAFT_2327748 [Mycena leptocephala]|nr:hypothetical protein B0H13DRAFT_2327748 [Mycena leptocephala]